LIEIKFNIRKDKILFFDSRCSTSFMHNQISFSMILGKVFCHYLLLKKKREVAPIYDIIHNISSKVIS